MKKIFAIVLVVALAAMMMAACGTPETAPSADAPVADAPASADASTDAPAADDGAPSADAPAADDGEFFVGLAFGGLDATPTVLMNLLTAKMDELGWKYVVTNGDLDINKSYADLENLCQQKPDVIFARSVNDLANIRLVEIATEAGIPIMIMSNLTVVDDKVGDPNYLGHVGDPELVRGVPLAEWVNDYCTNTNPGFVPKIGFLVGDIAIDAPGLVERSIDIRDGLTVEWEDVITAAADPAWSAAGGMKIAEDWMQKYPIDELNTLLVWSDEMCVGVIQALQAAGKNPDDYLVLSYDGLPIIEEYVADGWVDATSALGLEKVADTVIGVAQKIKDGKRDEVDFMSYANSIYIMDTENVKGIVDGTQQPEYWDYTGIIEEEQAAA